MRVCRASANTSLRRSSSRACAIRCLQKASSLASFDGSGSGGLASFAGVGSGGGGWTGRAVPAPRPPSGRSLLVSGLDAPFCVLRRSCSFRATSASDGVCPASTTPPLAHGNTLTAMTATTAERTKNAPKFSMVFAYFILAGGNRQPGLSAGTAQGAASIVSAGAWPHGRLPVIAPPATRAPSDRADMPRSLDPAGPARRVLPPPCAPRERQPTRHEREACHWHRFPDGCRDRRRHPQPRRPRSGAVLRV